MLLGVHTVPSLVEGFQKLRLSRSCPKDFSPGLDESKEKLLAASELGPAPARPSSLGKLRICPATPHGALHRGACSSPRVAHREPRFHYAHAAPASCRQCERDCPPGGLSCPVADCASTPDPRVQGHPLPSPLVHRKPLARPPVQFYQLRALYGAQQGVRSPEHRS